LRPFVNRAPD